LTNSHSISDGEAVASKEQTDENEYIVQCLWNRWRSFKSLNDLISMFPEITIFSRILELSEEKEKTIVSELNPNVNVLIPTRNPNNLSRCISSLLAKADRSFGQINFHFGIDHDDNKTEREIRKVCTLFGAYCLVHEVYNRAGDVSGIVNHMFMNIDEDAYFFRFNDDSEMLTSKWNSMAIRALRNEPTDVGIAKIIDLTNPGLQTHSFVSSTHKKIFGTYFPIHFKNIYEDNWITDVYSGVLTKKTFVKVKHHAIGSRYSAQTIPRDILTWTVQKSKHKIMMYLNKE
jgi:hypothetical protein